MKGKCMGVIREGRFGLSSPNTAQLCATYKIAVSEELVAFVQLPMKQFCELIVAHNITDTNDLVGKTVWVNVDDEGRMVYDKPCILAG